MKPAFSTVPMGGPPGYGQPGYGQSGQPGWLELFFSKKCHWFMLIIIIIFIIHTLYIRLFFC